MDVEPVIKSTNQGLSDKDQQWAWRFVCALTLAKHGRPHDILVAPRICVFPQRDCTLQGTSLTESICEVVHHIRSCIMDAGAKECR